MMKDKQEKSQDLTRRNFITSAGIAAAGVAAGGVLGTAKPVLGATVPVSVVVNGKNITGAKIEKNVTIAPVRDVAETLGAQVNWDGGSRTVTISGQAKGAASLPAWPWPYKKLDADLVRKRGYENYFQGGCMFATAAALILTLRDTVGFPYTELPVDFFKYGAGGVAGWGTLCGAPNGASFVFNMVTKDFSKLAGELLGWYTGFPFPSNKHEAYCKFPGQITTISESPLCHASVSKWSAASGKKVNSEEKKDRCAKLSGDTAAHAAELMNAYLLENKFIGSYKPSEEFAHCLGCHNGKTSVLDNEQGLMNCVSCHDPH